MPPSRPGAGGHARPPAFDQHQIASSNATANAFLGARQPSWMTSAAARNPNPRPGPPRQSVPSSAHKQQPGHPVLPSPAPSDEPSPALSGPLDSPNAKTASLSDAQSTTTPRTAPPAATSPTTDARFVPDLTADGPDVQEVPRPAAFGPAHRPQDQSPSVGGRPPQPASSGHQGGQASQDTPDQSGSVDGAPLPAVARVGPPPSKRRRTDQPLATPPSSAPPSSPVAFRCAAFLPMLEQHVQSCGGDQALEPSVERPRVQLLRQACRTEDELFLAVHQLFSVWSLRPGDVHRILGGHSFVIDSAFARLETLLKKNRFVSQAFQLWFARFPMPLHEWLMGPSGRPAILTHVATFLAKLAHEYETLMLTALARNFPYLVDELQAHLGCYSPVLQMIFFTACRRRLGVQDGDLSNRMEQLFREDQSKHRNGPLALAPVATPAEIEQRNAALIGMYRKIVVEAAMSRSLSSSPLPSSQIPATPPPGPPYTMAAPLSTTTAATLHSAPAPVPSQALPSAPAPVLSQAPLSAPGFSARPPGDAWVTQQRQQMPVNPPPQYQGQGSHILNRQTQMQMAVLQQQRQAAAQRAALEQRHQLLVQQQLNRQHYQLNSQPGYHGTAQTTPPHGAQSAQGMRFAQPPDGQAMLRADQLRQMQRVQQRQPTVSPSPLATNGAHPAPSPSPQRAPPQARRDPLERPLIPPHGVEIPRMEWPYDPSDKKSIMMSLHQAHVRSPKRVVKHDETERLYQAVESLPVGPAPLVPKNSVYEFRFDVTDEQFGLAAVKSRKGAGPLPVVEHFDGALRWRIRCCAAPTAPKAPTEQHWVTLDVKWPSHIFMTLNGHALDVRRQPHNGKDLPTDVTDLVVRGTNVLRVGLPEQQKDRDRGRDRNRFIAVELLETQRRSRIVDAVWSRGVIPEQQTVATIRSRLSPSSSSSPDKDDDIEIIFEAPDLSIDLADPFSATMFRVPARGAACKHLECFDLDTWLETRPPSSSPSKPRDDGDTKPPPPPPSNPDKWRCPICLADARPGSLRIDGFLMAVRAKLEAEGKLGAKALRVRADGGWSVVADDDDGGDGGDDDDGGGDGKKNEGVVGTTKNTSAVGGSGAGPRRQEVEIIEIDDD